MIRRGDIFGLTDTVFTCHREILDSNACKRHQLQISGKISLFETVHVHS